MRHPNKSLQTHLSPTLPEIEWMTFEGDPSKYGEFDNIGRQVSDDSQRLTRLLAECDGKARDGIKSWGNLPFGNRYSAAWKLFWRPLNTLTWWLMLMYESRGNTTWEKSKPQTSWRRLEDAKRLLTSMGLTTLCKSLQQLRIQFLFLWRSYLIKIWSEKGQTSQGTWFVPRDMLTFKFFWTLFRNELTAAWTKERKKRGL